ncbi:MAG: alanine racemase [Anaerovoracaceae bacterium]
MYKIAKRPAWAEIDLSAIDENIKTLKACTDNNSQMMGIIKADGYGHGASKVASVLNDNGVKTFGVATLDEAISLRDAGFTRDKGFDIVILGLTPSEYADVLIEYELMPVVVSFENAMAISKAYKKSLPFEIFVAVDSGMGRIGHLYDDAASIDEVKKISEIPNLKIAGLFSHFATADAEDKTFAKEQLSNYSSYDEKLNEAKIIIPKKTIANSAALMELSEAHFDIVRPGIALYGCYPSDEMDREKIILKPAMSIKANIVHLKTVPQGFTVGYGQKFKASRESKIATLTLGYADGLPRPYSAVAKVLVNGVFAPVAGNICMDQTMIDVTDVPNVKLGDEVVIMGRQGEKEILADEIARKTGTINYEIVCAFGQRLPKVYV